MGFRGDRFGADSPSATPRLHPSSSFRLGEVKAEQGLLVAWGGFNRAVLTEAKQGYFAVRLWESRDLVEAIYRNYEHLPAEIQADLPLKRVWMLVHDEPEA